MHDPRVESTHTMDAVFSHNGLHIEADSPEVGTVFYTLLKDNTDNPEKEDTVILSQVGYINLEQYILEHNLQ
jgi:hypothetical protein